MYENDDNKHATNTEDAGKHENPNTTVHVDILEEQETISKKREDEQRVQINNDSRHTQLEFKIKPPPIETKTIRKHETRKDTVVDMVDNSEKMSESNKTMLVNFFGSPPQQNTRYTNQMWLQNQEGPPKPTWEDRWNGKQYPDGFVGPLVYSPQTRNSFVKLVMSIVLFMLIATAGFIAYVWSTPDVKLFFLSHRWAIIIPALIGFVLIDFAMICSPCARRMPCNVILLFLTVVCLSVLAAKITVRFEINVVFYALLSTTAVVMVCCLLACSNYDFTSWSLYLVVIGTAFSVVAIIVMVIMALGTVIKPVVIAILAIGTLIQVVALTIQLQTILGGKSIELSEEDYALGAFMVYASIVDIFLKMVQIIGLSGN